MRKQRLKQGTSFARSPMAIISRSYIETQALVTQSLYSQAPGDRRRLINACRGVRSQEATCSCSICVVSHLKEEKREPSHTAGKPESLPLPRAQPSPIFRAPWPVTKHTRNLTSALTGLTRSQASSRETAGPTMTREQPDRKGHCHVPHSPGSPEGLMPEILRKR